MAANTTRSLCLRCPNGIAWVARGALEAESAVLREALACSSTTLLQVEEEVHDWQALLTLLGIDHEVEGFMQLESSATHEVVVPHHQLRGSHPVLTLRSASRLVILADKYQMDRISLLDTWLAEQLPPHLTMLSSTADGNLMHWLALTDRLPCLHLTRQALFGAMRDPRSGLFQRQFLRELAAPASHRRHLHISAADRQLTALSPDTLVLLVRCLATAGDVLSRNN